MSRGDKWKKYRQEIQEKADWRKLAESLGMQLTDQAPSHEGWVPCHSIDGNDENPSASFNVKSGYYKDFRDGEKAISPYDLLYEAGKADNFFDAQKYVANMFNIKMPSIGKEDPEHGVKWQEWLDVLLTQFIKNKSPITLEGLKAAGARLCVRHGESCIALPVTNISADIVGWMFLKRDGGTFKVGNGEAKAICKVHGDCKGVVGNPSTMIRLRENWAPETIYVFEGAPDLLSALSRDPNLYAFTNCHGASENINLKEAIYSDHETSWAIVADSDKPGLLGAAKKLSHLRSASAKVWRPEGEVEDKHGKDFRDVSIEHFNKSICTGLIQCEELSYDKLREEHEESDRKERLRMHESEVKSAHAVLKRVGCMILSVDHGGEIELYSMATKSSKVVSAISALQYDDMIQFLGFDFRYFVHRTAEDITREQRGGYIFKDFKKLLALASTDVRYQDSQKVGAGIWAVEDKDRERTGDLLIVKHGEAYKYNGSLRVLDSPVCERLVAKMSERIDWFEADILANYTEKARDIKWRAGVYEELYKILNQWNWGNEHMTELTCGLIFATWIQAIHKWRPMVTVTGESNSGKTVLMQFIEDQFLGLANASARSTAAGVLQSLGDNSQPILLDEFDNGAQQEGLMERFRVASRGQQSLYGTAGQGGKTYKICHLVWFSGIYAASRSQADMNRMINLRLLQAPDNKKTITIPSKTEVRDLGHKILAGILASTNDAIELTDRLTELRSDDEKIQSRYRESYSVPYGCLGAFIGLDLDGINDVMTSYLTDVVGEEVAMSDASTDQDQLLLDILSSEVRLPNDGNAPVDHASVAEILFKANLAKYRDHARTKGVGYVIPKKGSADPKVAFAGRRLTGKGGLLKGTDWSDQRHGVLQILERVDRSLKPRKEKQVVAGSLLTCVSLDYKALRRWCEGDTDRKRAVGLAAAQEA